MSSLKLDWGKYVEEQENLTSQLLNLNVETKNPESTTPSTTSNEPASAPEQTPDVPKENEPASAELPSLALTENLAQSNVNDEKGFLPADKSLLEKMFKKGLVETKTSLEIQRKNKDSPLYSVKSFEALNLKPELLKGVYGMGFNTPSKIQETVLPILLKNDPVTNIIAQSQSGTGKTAAFVLAMLSRVDPTKKYPQVVCLSPTLELAMQTGEVANKMAQFLPEIKIKYAVKGENLPRGTRLTDHIIIGTPGKVLDWSLKFKFLDLSKVSVFVLDEADVMIAVQGHQDQCNRIRNKLPSTCQMLFFSATYEPDVMEFAEEIVDEPRVIHRLEKEEESIDNIKQYYVECRDLEGKYQAITNIYGTISIGQAMIFCQTRKTANWLSSKMIKDGHAVAILSGEQEPSERMAILERFREGVEKVLITTNVLARGIDVEQVTLVVNFDMPVDQSGRADCETYLHRIGRTGRFGKHGIAINLIDSPQSMRVCKDIEQHFKKKIVSLDCEDVDEIEKIGK